MYGQHDDREARIKQFERWLNADHMPLNAPREQLNVVTLNKTTAKDLERFAKNDTQVDNAELAESVAMIRIGLDAGIHVDLRCETQELAEAVKEHFNAAELKNVTITFGVNQHA